MRAYPPPDQPLLKCIVGLVLLGRQQQALLDKHLEHLAVPEHGQEASGLLVTPAVRCGGGGGGGVGGNSASGCAGTWRESAGPSRYACSAEQGVVVVVGRESGCARTWTGSTGHSRYACGAVRGGGGPHLAVPKHGEEIPGLLITPAAVAVRGPSEAGGGDRAQQVDTVEERGCG